MTGIFEQSSVDAPRRRIRRLFAFGKGIVAMDAAHRPIIPEAPHPATTTSGVVLSAETFRHTPELARRMRADGVLPGVRADRGFELMRSDGSATVTAGLDGLTERLLRLHQAGAEFAVWNMAVGGGPGRAGYPGRVGLVANGMAAARFAHTCHDLALVPLIRVPRSTAPAVHATVLVSLCASLDEFDVDLAAVVISTRPGVDGALDALPARLGGVALATDTVGPAEAAAWLAKARADHSPRWPLTFYLSREATAPYLKAAPYPKAAPYLKAVPNRPSIGSTHGQDSRRRAGR